MSAGIPRWRRVALLILLPLLSCTPAMGRQESTLRILLEGGEYEQLHGMSAQQAEEVRRGNYLRHPGSATYRFQVGHAGWYVLWVQAADWHTDLSLDGRFLLHTPFVSGVWRDRDDMKRVLNLYLAQGSHTLEFSRPWHPGLPYVRRILLERALSSVEMARMTLLSEHTVMRAGEALAVRIDAGRRDEAYRLVLRVRTKGSKPALLERNIEVPAGAGDVVQTVTLPTAMEGAHVVSLTSEAGFAADREIEYVVVDTSGPRAVRRSSRRELVQEIDPATRAPEYSSGDSRIARGAGPAYRESGDRGKAGNGANGSFFAYKLQLPEGEGHYVVEIDHPDDANRSFTLSVMQDYPSPYHADAGVQTGAPYPASGTTQTHEVYFHARQRDPRLLALNWHGGQRAAVTAIRVYRIPDALPLADTTPTRHFGLYLEEPLRFPAYFGGDPMDAGWDNLLQSAIRYAEWTRYLGADTWLQTIAAYQTTLWPARTLPGFGPDDESGLGHGLLHARPSPRDPVQKDIVRLMLLVCEKYRLRFLPELQMYPNAWLVNTLFGNATAGPRPWLTESAAGGTGEGDQNLPWLNPAFPPVQQWARSVVQEVAGRYRDSPALEGVAIRLLGYAFGSWQSFASLQWGYDDYTVRRFLDERGPGRASPLYTSGTHARRFAELTGPRHDEWVQWRIATISHHHAELARTLTRVRPDLKLHVNAFGPHFSVGEYYEDARSLAARERRGWLGLIRETGLDPPAYARDPAIRFSDAIRYPAGARAPGGSASTLGAALYRESLDAAPIAAAARPAGSGSVAQLRLYNEYLEANLPGSLVGLENLKGPDGRPQDFRICSVLVPAGHHLLARYAEALAEGNITALSDGGMGYILNQPRFLRDFLREYGALPDTGMTRLRDAPAGIAVWQGRAESGRALYVINRTAESLHVRLQFKPGPRLRRAVTREPVTTDASGATVIEIGPYGLIGLLHDAADSAATSASYVAARTGAIP